MLIICPNCFAKFDVNDRLLKKDVQKFVCSNCGEHFEENLQALKLDETEPFNVRAADDGLNMTDETLVSDAAAGQEAAQIYNAANEQNADPLIHDKPSERTDFTWDKEKEEDLSVQSLPEEFTPVREKKKNVSGLWFVLLFFVAVFGILFYSWLNRDDIFLSYPNLQKGVHLIMGKPYSTLPGDKKTPVSASSQETDTADVVQAPAGMAQVHADDEHEPQDPTQELMNEGAQNRPAQPQDTPSVSDTSAALPGGRPVNENTARAVTMQGAVSDATDDVTLQEIDLNALPGENMPDENAQPLAMNGQTPPMNLQTKTQQGQIQGQEINLEDEIIDINAPLMPSESAYQNAGATGAQGINAIGTTGADTIVAPVYGQDNQEPIILDEVALPVIDEAGDMPTNTPAVQLVPATGVQVKDVVFRYDTSLSSRPKLYVQGIVSNMTPDVITMPALKVDMFDKDNKLIATQTIPATSSKLGVNMAEFFFREIEPLPAGLVRRVNITVQNATR